MAQKGGKPATNAPQNMFQFKLVLLGKEDNSTSFNSSFFFFHFHSLHSFPIGDSAVGKSSLVLRFVKGQFHEYQESTIGGRPLFLPFSLGSFDRIDLLEWFSFPLSLHLSL